MSDAYDGRDSQRTNAPCGHFRSELVQLVKADTIELSGSPIEYFCHPDYRNGAHEVTGAYKLGIAGIYNHTDAAWKSPNVVVDSVSTDGYTINLTGAHGCDDDLVEVFYYARYVSPAEHTAAAQVGDPLTSETMDVILQKINDLPPLDFENASPTMKFDMKLATSTTVPTAGVKTTLLKYTTTTGTWQTSETPFYVTAIFLGWTDSLDADISNGHDDDVTIYITVDSGTEFSFSLADSQRLVTPANSGAGGSVYRQGWQINLGLVECRSEFIIAIDESEVGFTPGSWQTTISGYCT